MTTTRVFELAITNGLSNKQAKKKFGRSGDVTKYIVTNRGTPVSGTGKPGKAPKK